jgi:hypothetical protein
MAELFRFVSLRGPAPVDQDTAPFVVRVRSTSRKASELSPALQKFCEMMAAVGWQANAKKVEKFLGACFDGLSLEDVPDSETLRDARAAAEQLLNQIAYTGTERTAGDADRATTHALAAEWIERLAATDSRGPYIALNSEEQQEHAREFFIRAVIIVPAIAQAPLIVDATRRMTITPGTHRNSTGTESVASLKDQLAKLRAARKALIAIIKSGKLVNLADNLDAASGLQLVDGIPRSGDLVIVEPREAEELLDAVDAAIRVVVAALAEAGDRGEGQPAARGSSKPKDPRNDAKDEGAPVPIRLGVGDLLLTELQSTSYAYGDIAHVENVLAGETRERNFNKVRSSESDVLSISETESITEKDSQSTQRFELEKASQSSLKETLDINAGASVSGQYGPVSAQASFGIGSMTARESSQNQSTKLAQEVVSKASSKVRQLTSTQTRTITKVVVTDNTFHSMKNDQAGAKHIIGVYRWVDRIEQLQLVNYGHRLMLGLTVPEPGAYLRWLATRRAISGAGTPAPTVQRGSGMSPLMPQDITPDNYLTWVVAYSANDVEPPPLRFITQAIGLESDPSASAEKPGQVTKTDTSMTVPAGYRAMRARGSVIAYDELSGPFNIPGMPLLLSDVQIAVGPARTALDAPASSSRDGLVPFSFDIDVPGSSTPLGTETSAGAKLPISVSVHSAKGYGLTLEVVFERTDAALSKWQIDSWGKIMQAYKNLRAAEDEAASRSQLPGVQIDGSNPLEYRQRERAEVKRACIEILAGAVGTVDAVKDDAGVRPHIDRGKVASLEEMIRFFHDAFEWEHTSWDCLDYFWAPEGSWDDLMAITDGDADQKAFLAAGAAKVTLPVRPGYETLVLYRLWSQRTWPGDRAPLPDIEAAVALGSEVATTPRGAPQRGVAVPGGNWAERSPTELVILQPEALLGWTPPTA